jgi:uncharacterized membrane protein
MADFLRAGAEIAREGIDPVSIIPGLVVGLITLIVLAPLSMYGIYSLIKDNCPKDDKKTTTNENCKNAWVWYVVMLVIVLIISYALGRFVYMIMFSIKNPKIAAGILATGMVSSAIRG